MVSLRALDQSGGESVVGWLGLITFIENERGAEPAVETGNPRVGVCKAPHLQSLARRLVEAGIQDSLIHVGLCGQLVVGHWQLDPDVQLGDVRCETEIGEALHVLGETREIDSAERNMELKSHAVDRYASIEHARYHVVDRGGLCVDALVAVVVVNQL